MNIWIYIYNSSSHTFVLGYSSNLSVGAFLVLVPCFLVVYLAVSHCCLVSKLFLLCSGLSVVCSLPAGSLCMAARPVQCLWAERTQGRYQRSSTCLSLMHLAVVGLFHASPTYLCHVCCFVKFGHCSFCIWVLSQTDCASYLISLNIN